MTGLSKSKRGPELPILPPGCAALRSRLGRRRKSPHHLCAERRRKTADQPFVGSLLEIRDHDPTTGRYTEFNLIGLAVGLNGYEYARFNPLTLPIRWGLTHLDQIQQAQEDSRRRRRR